MHFISIPVHLPSAYRHLLCLSSAVLLNPCRTSRRLYHSVQLNTNVRSRMRKIATMFRAKKGEAEQRIARSQGFTPRSYQSQIYSRSVRGHVSSFPKSHHNTNIITRPPSAYHTTCHPTCPTPPPSVPLFQLSGGQLQYRLKDCRPTHLVPRALCRAVDCLPQGIKPPIRESHHLFIPLKIRMTISP